ncbi:sugar O-acyltransferase (sialic acid O-acetyltransferase NeuD family) [Deinobacterium chartae]|uniref:Sugar O-acyltransferase (Sialic acid O-acetyltransferase NeuD family) n=1 Tax=Deinobacterium chartae TaxID=521158 RepID=A0A841HWS9_9DEIO|nr:acetyltransferase [Deinobacterium chartae]MBB6097847.1 sugar O-acyltransferase (sialic acid O-acetyltransferase NeuD family) [Deinobacterium chartae]
MTGIFVLGAGGHAKVVIATLHAAGLPVRGVLDDNSSRAGEKILDVPVLGGMHLLNEVPDPQAVIAIGSNRARAHISQRYPRTRWISVTHPMASVHPSARIGAGTVVCAGAVVQPDAILGEHVIVNTGASVDHDCILEDFVHVAPGVRLAGGVHLEEGVLMGVASAAIPGVKVGAWSTVGAGGAVIGHLESGITAVGVPARPRNTEVKS